MYEERENMIMNALEIVKTALGNMEKGTIRESDYTEDMTFSGPVPKPLKREEYVSLMKNLVAGIPDWNFHARNFSADGDTVRVTVEITGTQTRTLKPVMPGMEALPPTNRKFKLPEEHLTVKVQGDRISEFHADVPANGGLPGILAQLGAPLKKAA
jgi:hypothetical protein